MLLRSGSKHHLARQISRGGSAIVTVRLDAEEKRHFATMKLSEVYPLTHAAYLSAASPTTTEFGLSLGFGEDLDHIAVRVAKEDGAMERRRIVTLLPDREIARSRRGLRIIRK